jgi:hypothetical protein
LFYPYCERLHFTCIQNSKKYWMFCIHIILYYDTSSRSHPSAWKWNGAISVFQVHCRNKDKIVSHFGSQNIVQCDVVDYFVMLHRQTIDFILPFYNRFLNSIAVKCIVEIGKVTTVWSGEVRSIIYNQINL